MSLYVKILFYFIYAICHNNNCVVIDCSFSVILVYNNLKMDNKKISEDPNTKELNQFVQNMLKQMQERFDEMSSNIIGRVD